MRAPLTAASVPLLPRHVKLRHDAARGRWLVLAPERVLVPDNVAVAVLQRVNGALSIQAIAEDLAETYTAPPDLILTEVLILLQDLADKDFLREVAHAG